MIRLFTITTLFFSFSSLLAQSPSMIYYKGLGRSVADLDKMDENSNYLKNDSTSERRDLNGFFLFDLGIYVEPNEQLRATAIMRLYNPFGAFYSFGSLFRFRQVTLEGLLAKKFYYKVGDMDLKLTPYTLYNNADSWYEFESKIFADRRAIMQYENFNNGNNWRVQGAYVQTGWRFPNWADSLNLKVFAVRTNRANLTTMPDRLFTGGELGLVGTKYIDAGVRAIQHFDVVGTSADSTKSYSNTVVSFNAALKWNNTQYDLRLTGEGGFSNYKKENTLKKISNTTSDSFFETGLYGKQKKTGIYASVIYRYVGAEFTSAGAQTRRVNDLVTGGGMFATGQNGAITRVQTLYDRVQYTGLYNYAITDGFAPYFNPYNIVNPYGNATPNRAGLTATIGIQKDSLINAKVFWSSQSEIVAIGVDSNASDRRKYNEIGAGFNFMLNKALGWKKEVSLSAGYKQSQVKRDGSNSIDLKANYLDLGIQIEIVDKIDLLLGYKAFAAKGTELLIKRDALNRYLGSAPEDLVSYDFSESTLSIGAKYRLSPLSYVTCTYGTPTYKNNLYTESNYKYSQFFINFTIGF